MSIIHVFSFGNVRATITVQQFKISKFYIVPLTVSKNLKNLASLDIYKKMLQESTYNQFEIRISITFPLH